MKTKKGFHYSIVIIILLVVVIVGLLGYVLWQSLQNNNNKPAQNTNTNTNTTQNVTKGCGADKSFKADAGLGYNFSFSYPCDWVVSENFVANDPNTEVPRDKVTVTSPTSKTVVKYDVGYMGGLGGMCDETDPQITANGTMQSYTSNQINGISGSYLIEYIYKNNDTVKQVKSYIANKGTFTVGGNYCQQYLTEILALNPKTEKSDGSRWSGIWTTSIVLSDIQNSDGSVKANLKVADVVSARATDEYTQAKNILLSSAYSKL